MNFENKKATRQSFGEILKDIGYEDEKIIVLDAGKIVAYGNPKEVLKHISTSSCIKLTQTGGENGIN